jgi:F420-0:gamma-glutamyl ligase
MTAQFSAFGVPNIPMIEHGDCLSDIIMQALDNAGLTLQAGDVVQYNS